jgi:uncharacterized protein
MAEVSVRQSGNHGLGVFVERGFRRGEVILEIDDSDPVLDRGKLTSEQGIFIDVFVGADGTQKTAWMKSPEKFINHSCDPNSFVRTDIGSGARRTVALKDLRTDDEVTWDYAANIWEEWVAPVTCGCGARTCRKVIEGNYFTLAREIQRKLLPLLDEPFKRRFAREIHSPDLGAGAR